MSRTFAFLAAAALSAAAVLPSYASSDVAVRPSDYASSDGAVRPSEEKTEFLLSPNGNLRLEFRLKDGDKPCYRLSFGDRTVVDWSGMGFLLDDGGLFDWFELTGVTRDEIDETWSPSGAKRAAYATAAMRWRSHSARPLRTDI